MLFWRAVEIQRNSRILRVPEAISKLQLNENGEVWGLATFSQLAIGETVSGLADLDKSWQRSYYFFQMPFVLAMLSRKPAGNEENLVPLNSWAVRTGIKQNK